MAQLRMTTYKDVIDHLADYAGAAVGDQTERYCRRSIQLAYDDLPATHNWTYFFTRGRIATVAPQSTGTIQYTNSTSTVTLTGATWPSWVTQGVIVINNIPYPIPSSPTSTTLVLTPGPNPGADIAAGTSYTLFQDTYRLPIDFTSCDRVFNINNGQPLEYGHLADWLELQRIYRGPALPRLYGITGMPGFQGAMSMRIFPAPDNIYFLDFIYKRRPRQLNQITYSTGTASTTSGSTTVTGTGTTWTAQMVGSSFRLSAQGVADVPTGPGGAAPFFVERVVTGFTSATSLTLDADPAQTLNLVQHAISDPVDIEEGAMLTFFYRECEKQLRIIRRMKPTDREDQQYMESMERAFEADNRSTEQRVVGEAGFVRRLRDYPRGPDGGA